MTTLSDNKSRHNHKPEVNTTPPSYDHETMLQQSIEMINRIPFYEEVGLYYPNDKPNFKRPIIFVGPKMIGQRELIERMIANNTSRFSSPISHTTRNKLSHERDGFDFHFVSRASFESLIKAGKFIECGQFQGQYYGTTFDALERIVNSGKTCVHLISIPSIFNFHHGLAGCKLKPFLVFVKPQYSNEPIRLRKHIANSIGTRNDNQRNSVSPNDLDGSVNSIMAEVNLVEQHLLAYFDLVMNVTSDIEHAYRELLLELDKIEREPQWIPKFWCNK